MCFSRQDASSHKQYDLIGSPRDLHLRSNFGLDFYDSMRMDEANMMVPK